MAPVLAAVFQAYGLMPGVDSMEQLAIEIQSSGAGCWAGVATSIIASAQNTEVGALGHDLLYGSSIFGSQWNLICNKIYQLNADATVIALNLYNPFVATESLTLYGLYEALIGLQINNILYAWDEVNEGGYVADIHNAFGLEPEAVAFSLAWTTLNPDIHPTTFGHKVIFETLTELGDIRAFQPHRAMEKLAK